MKLFSISIYLRVEFCFAFADCHFYSGSSYHFFNKSNLMRQNVWCTIHVLFLITVYTFFSRLLLFCVFQHCRKLLVVCTAYQPAQINLCNFSSAGHTTTNARYRLAAAKVESIELVWRTVHAGLLSDCWTYILNSLCYSTN